MKSCGFIYPLCLFDLVAELLQENLKVVIKFEKYSSSGNDFIIIDNRKNLIKDPANFAMLICKRKLNIGADGLLLLERSKNADFKMRIINSDGSEAEMCGNGVRCMIHFAYKDGISGKKMMIETLAGLIDGEVMKDDIIRVKLTNPESIELNFSLNIFGERIKADFINTGVPHTCIIREDIEKIPVKRFGKKIRYHEKFQPAGTNVNFIKVENNNIIKIRTYERGVEDETFSCGTGAAASAIITSILGKTEPPVNVITKSEEMLTIYFEKRENGDIENVFLEGRVKPVFKGEFIES